MGCCNKKDTRRVKDWGGDGSNKSSKKSLAILPGIAGIVILGLIIYKLII